MAWPFPKKRYFALAGGSNSSMLAEIFRVPKEPPHINVLATTRDLPLNNEVNLNRLLASVPHLLPGTISLALPLSYFQTMTLTLPMMPKEAVGQALPYHLAKGLGQPLKELLYDWQIIRRQRENLQVQVYLFPCAAFELLRQELAHKELVVNNLEADVFAAFSYLITQNRLAAANATLCMLVWRNSVSVAIYELRKLTLIREVKLAKPAPPFTGIAQASPPRPDREPVARDDRGPTPATVVLDQDVETILDGFNILVQDTNQSAGPEASSPDDTPAGTPEESPGTSAKGQEDSALQWDHYINQLALEVLRTRDYYQSVVKGAPIKNVLVGGAGQFLPQLKAIAEKSLETEIDSLLTGPSEEEDHLQLLKAISLGTGARW